jgi:hypothetical protein
LEWGTPNEIRCALIEIATDNPQGDALHWRLMDALEAMFDRGAEHGKALVKQQLEEFMALVSEPPGKPVSRDTLPGLLQ